MSVAVQEPPEKKTSKKQGSKKPSAATSPKTAAPTVRPAAAANAAPIGETPRIPVPVTLGLFPEVIEALQNEAEKRGTSFEAVALDALHRGLRQILWGSGDPAAKMKMMGLVPRKPLPPGKTLKDIMDELRSSLPPDEDDLSDEEYQRILERD